MSKPMTEQEKKNFEAAVAANIEVIKSVGAAEKYDHYGIYCIKVDNKIVYVGKSRNMLKRIAQHMWEIENNEKKNMYCVLRELRHLHHHLAFDVLETIEESGEQQEDDDKIGFAEARLIRHYLPCLNTQIPHMDNYRSYDTQKRAKTITVKEVEEILDNDV